MSRASSVFLFLGLLPQCALTKTFRYIALGDFGTGGYKWGSTAELSCALQFHELAAEVDAQFTISVGDNSYVPPLEGMRDSFEDTWNREGSHGGGTWFAAAGNHDQIGPQINYHSAKTEKDKKWYLPATKYTVKLDTGLGFKVQIWNVDSNDNGQGQRPWLKDGLQNSDARWKIIITHFPWTNSGRHARVSSPGWIAQEAKAGGAQVSFCGHDHILQTNIHEGVAFVTTGAVARGGMMARPIEQDKTEFIWTLGLKTSVPGHGMMSLQLTKDVMWGTTWAYGGVVHEFVTVWDWPKVWRDHKPEGGGKPEASFPSPSVVKSYLAKSSPAPASAPSAPIPMPPAIPPPEPTPPPVPPPNKAKSLALALIAQSEAASTTPPPPELPKLSPEQQKAVAAASQAFYLVSSECVTCSGPTAGKPLTVWIQGAKKEDVKVFLGFTERGCSEEPRAPVPGASPTEVPKSGVVKFTPRLEAGASIAVYVCLSVDGGKAYAPVRQAESGLSGFMLLPPQPEPAEGKAVPWNAARSNPAYYVEEGGAQVGPPSGGGVSFLAMLVGVFVFSAVLVLVVQRVRSQDTDSAPQKTVR
eukprot:Hpha_TRINITY_DN16706_c1_g21::TRINITY_DN16706_c1_g21_i1::g.78799::m.78799/K14379/ACP5; tartrate-resistant acid phosphatase type 5